MEFIKINNKCPDLPRQQYSETTIVEGLQGLSPETSSVLKWNACFTYQDHACIGFELLHQDLCQYVENRGEGPLVPEIWSSCWWLQPFSTWAPSEWFMLTSGLHYGCGQRWTANLSSSNWLQPGVPSGTSSSISGLQSSSSDVGHHPPHWGHRYVQCEGHSSGSRNSLVHFWGRGVWWVEPLNPGSQPAIRRASGLRIGKCFLFYLAKTSEQCWRSMIAEETEMKTQTFMRVRWWFNPHNGSREPVGEPD